MKACWKSLLGVALCVVWPAFGQSYPSQTIRLVVAAAPGGGPDVTARFLALKFSKALGQQIVVDNRAGANGAIGAENVSKAAPDGHTWLLATGQHATNPSLQKNLAYDIVKDFTPARFHSVIRFHHEFPENRWSVNHPAPQTKPAITRCDWAM